MPTWHPMPDEWCVEVDTRLYPANYRVMHKGRDCGIFHSLSCAIAYITARVTPNDWRDFACGLIEDTLADKEQ